MWFETYQLINVSSGFTGSLTLEHVTATSETGIFALRARNPASSFTLTIENSILSGADGTQDSNGKVKQDCALGTSTYTKVIKNSLIQDGSCAGVDVVTGDPAAGRSHRRVAAFSAERRQPGAGQRRRDGLRFTADGSNWRAPTSHRMQPGRGRSGDPEPVASAAAN